MNTVNCREILRWWTCLKQVRTVTNSNRTHLVKPEGKLRKIWIIKELVGLDRETSNTLFEVIEDWEHQLQASDFINIIDEWEEKIEEPQP